MGLKTNIVIGPGCPRVEKSFAVPFINGMADLAEEYIAKEKPKHGDGRPITGLALIIYQLVDGVWSKIGQADIGEFGEEGCGPYRKWAEGKCQPLIENPVAQSSFELRDEEAEEFGGGVHVVAENGEESIIAVSAFEEDEDEALVLINCERTERFPTDFADQYVVISCNGKVGYISDLLV